ncbi:MAG: response regulator [Sodalis sp. (in: enterobacteria)]|uniref:response regulator n=1 Tax=Sodalis sp. (in: enterobacteria) TaxID=1898979 RepID=UPI0039E40E97
MAQEYHYDLILLDVMMPEVNGWEVMKTLDSPLDTPVIFLTAKSTVDDCWFRSRPITDSDFTRSLIPVARSAIPILSDRSSSVPPYSEDF